METTGRQPLQLTRTFCVLAFTTLVTSCLVVGGCSASQPPKALLDARVAYQAAAESPGAARAQADVAEAKQALDTAEAAFKDDADGAGTLDWAYIAQRKAASARAKANALTVLDSKKAMDGQLQALRNQRDALQKSDLTASRNMAQSERQARIAAEQKTRDAMLALGAVEGDRGLVLTLSGSVLFQTGKSTLLPAAQARLKEAAQALKEDGRPITIVGHTDSTGSDESNQKLSLARAESVRSYLTTTGGLTPDRVKAEGLGESAPIADNATPDGRANNRRVEIVIAKDANGGSAGPTTTTTTNKKQQ